MEAGRAGLLALDTTNKLWIRRGLSPQYPEGVSWAPVCGQVPHTPYLCKYFSLSPYIFAWFQVRSVTAGDAGGDIWAVVDTEGVSVVVARWAQQL